MLERVRENWRLVVIGVVVLVVAAFFWYKNVCLNPERVFWAAIGNSLSAGGVTTEIKQTSDGSKITQLTQFELGLTDRARSLTVVSQGKNHISTEVIGTKDADYTRYTDIRTDQKQYPVNAKAVKNVWAKSDNQTQSDTQAAGHQLFAQAVLGVGLPVGNVPVPVAGLSAKERAILVDYMRSGHVYELSLKNVKKQRVGSHLFYTYDVKMQIIPYVHMMKQLAKQLGFHELDSVDANTYQSAAPVQLKITIDAWTKEISSIENKTVNYKQTYSAYGMHLDASLPKKTVTLTTLQQLLSGK